MTIPPPTAEGVEEPEVPKWLDGYLVMNGVGRISRGACVIYDPLFLRLQGGQRG